jgi:hypothetical protein
MHQADHPIQVGIIIPISTTFNATTLTLFSMLLKFPPIDKDRMSYTLAKLMNTMEMMMISIRL